jgi:hypothetical protein
LQERTDLPTNGAIIGDDGEFAEPGFIPVPTAGGLIFDAIFDPQAELDRQGAVAFNREARASGAPPAAEHRGPVGHFHKRSLRRG